MDDCLTIKFSDAERTAQGLLGDAETLYDVINYLQQVYYEVLDSGLQGSFRHELDARYEYLTSELQALNAENEESGHDLLTAAARLRELDAECANLFNTRSLPTVPSVVVVRDPNGNIITVYDRYPGVENKDFAYHLGIGREDRAYTGYREGTMTWDEAIDYMTEDPFRPTWRDYVDAKATIADVTYAEQAALWSNNTALGNWGNIHTSAMSAENIVGASYSFDERGLEAKISSEQGLYLAKVQANANVAGFDAAGQGYVGANFKNEASAVVNPITGDVSVRGGSEFFAGGRLDGSINRDFGAVGVGAQGSVSYGVGYTLEGEVGYKNGVFKADLDIGATLGIGAEFGINVELDVPQAGRDILKGIESLF